MGSFTPPYVQVPREPAAPLTLLVRDKRCEDCDWPELCASDRTCWHEEQQAGVEHRAQLREQRKAEAKLRGANTLGRYSREQVITCIQAFAEQNGRPPYYNEWHRYGPGRPSTKTVIRLFGSWAKGIEAAGLRPARIKRGKEFQLKRP